MQWNSTLQIHNSNTPLIIKVYLNGIEQMLFNLKTVVKLNMVFSRIIIEAQKERFIWKPERNSVPPL